MDIVIGIGEYAISRNNEDVIKTYALASCVAITVYNPGNRTAGMAHIALPEPNEIYTDELPPCYFAKKAVPLLVNRICKESGCSKHELEISIFGGAESVRRCDIFKIGEKNVRAVKAALRNLGLYCKGFDTGGTDSRTIEMDAATGSIKVMKQPLTI